MRLTLLILLLLPSLASAQLGGNCTWQTTFSYDAAGNRIQRKDACVPNPPVSQSGTPGFRMPAPAATHAAPELRIYPNPAQTAIHLAFTTPVSRGQVTLYHLHGSLVAEAPFEGDAHTLHLPPLAAGIYLLRIASEEGTWEEKIRVGE
jgi:hypothetical protein